MRGVRVVSCVHVCGWGHNAVQAATCADTPPPHTFPACACALLQANAAEGNGPRVTLPDIAEQPNGRRAVPPAEMYVVQLQAQATTPGCAAA